MYNHNQLERISRSITLLIEEELKRCGIFFRIFYRCKTLESINGKISTKKYDGNTRFLRDAIGIRIAFYFRDDIDIIHPHLKNKFTYMEETIDKNSATEFKPTRLNIIFRIPTDHIIEFKEIVQNEKIDTSFEIQLRTVLSEGWHEVDHDMRYKCESDWANYFELGRTFNGVLAALESSDWTMLKIFDSISYEHYKKNECAAMLRSKLRLRLIENSFREDISTLLMNNKVLRKQIFKINREEFINNMLTENVIFPLTLDNIIYYINYKYIKDEQLLTLTPQEFILLIN